MKKPLRPKQDPVKFTDASSTSFNNFDQDRRSMEEAANGKEFLSLSLNKIVTSLDNTRTLPIPFERFIEIDWPTIEDQSYKGKIKQIVSEESLHEKYTKLTAYNFYLSVYLLAIDIKHTGLTQPIGVIEVESQDYLFALAWGQRRYMACFIAKIATIESVVNKIDIQNQRLISHIQDSENDLRVQPLLLDRIAAKRKKWVEYTSTNPTPNKGRLYDFLGVNRTDGQVLTQLFASSYEDQYMEYIQQEKIESLRMLRQMDFSHPPVGLSEINSIGSKKKSHEPRKGPPPLTALGIRIEKNSEINLLEFLMRSASNSGDFSEELSNSLKKYDLKVPEHLKNALREVAEFIYAK